MAATVQVEKAGDVNELLESAKTIGLDDNEREALKAAAAEKLTKEPEPGSFERFMSTFGSPGRWAGH